MKKIILLLVPVLFFSCSKQEELLEEEQPLLLSEIIIGNWYVQQVWNPELGDTLILEYGDETNSFTEDSLFILSVGEQIIVEANYVVSDLDSVISINGFPVVYEEMKIIKFDENTFTRQSEPGREGTFFHKFARVE